jgi:hypothetical protein
MQLPLPSSTPAIAILHTLLQFTYGKLRSFSVKANDMTGFHVMDYAQR